MMLTVEDAYNILGIDENTTNEEAYKAYMGLSLKCTDAFLRGEPGASELQDRVTEAWHAVDIATNEKTAGKPFVKIKSYEYNWPTTSSLVIQLILSVLLLGAALYGMYSLIRYVSGEIAIGDCFSKGILNLYNSLCSFLDLSGEYNVLGSKGEYAELIHSYPMLKNLDLELFRYLGSASITASFVMIIVMLFLSVLQNIAYLIYNRKIEKIAMGRHIISIVDFSAKERRANIFMGILNISYSVLCYISVALNTFAFYFVAIVAFVPNAMMSWLVHLSWIISGVGFVICLGLFLTKKMERLRGARYYELHENVITYVFGLLLFLIPLLISAAVITLAWMIIAIIILVVLFSSVGEKYIVVRY